LMDWARRHGATAPVARAFGLASQAVGHGHTCLRLDAVDTTMPADDNLAQTLVASDLVGTPGDLSRPLIIDNNRLYLQRYHAYETLLAARLRALLATAADDVAIDRLLPGHGLF